jgi:hypothetical protein
MSAALTAAAAILAIAVAYLDDNLAKIEYAVGETINSMKEAFSFVNENVVGVVAALSTVVTVSG